VSSRSVEGDDELGSQLPALVHAEKSLLKVKGIGFLLQGGVEIESDT